MRTVLSVHACDVYIKVTKGFKYLDSIVLNNDGSCRKLKDWHGPQCAEFSQCKCCHVLSLKLVVVPISLYDCKTWTLNIDLGRHVNAFR